MLPTFVIIGAQKSASSFLQECLAVHPDIFLPAGETPFFESPDYEQSTIADLELLFAGRPERCRGIKRPSYLGKPEVPARITKHLPDAQLIAVLRNPVDRALSAYYHYINAGFLAPLDVETGMPKLISSPAFTASYKRASEIIEFGYYSKHLRRYSHYLDSGRLLVLLHEDIVADPLASIQRAYDFLGVEPEFVPTSLSSRPQEVIYSVPRLRILTLRNRFLYNYSEDGTRAFPRELSLLGKIIAGSIATFDRHLLSRCFNGRKPVLGPDLHRMIYDLYADDIGDLESQIDRDLSAWKPDLKTH